jgi:hypothetical protein
MQRKVRRITTLLIATVFGLGGLTASANAKSMSGESNGTVSESGRAAPVLGKRNFVPGTSGFGTAHPRFIHNGGSPSGSADHIRWTRWGANRAIGRGVTPLFKPGGGFYRRPGKIVLRARRLGRCSQGGRLAYTRLRSRSARKPGGPLVGPFRPWLGGNICRF